MGLALLAMGVNAHHQSTGGKGSSNNSGTGHNGQGAGSSSESEDWGDESWIVDCPCGVNFDDGDEMVECDECGVWVHTSCCQVPKSLPTYVCDKCKEKKRKEREESEVAQLLVELPGKTVSFEHKSYQRTDMLLGQPRYCSTEVPIERRVHEQGVPGGDPAIFVGASKVFSQQLWKCTGYIPKLLQVQYTEIPNWQDEPRTESSCLFDLPKQQVKESPLKNVKRSKQEHETKMPSSDGEMQRSKIPLDDDAPRKDKHGKKLEVIRHSKHKHKFRGLKDEKNHSHSKRIREDVKDQFSRKKMKASPDALRVDHDRHKRGHFQQSPKNPKAMKKTAVQEFMDGDSRICSKCLRPEPTLEDEQGRSLKPLVCQDCQKTGSSTRHGMLAKKQEHRLEMEGKLDLASVKGDQHKKHRSDVSNHDRTNYQNFSPETASTELPKHFGQQRVQPLDGFAATQCMELLSGYEIKSTAPEGESAEQSSMSRQQRATSQHGAMKPPLDDSTSHLKRSIGEPTEERQQKTVQGCQLSIKTTSFSKSDIPSPASINSGGPSGTLSASRVAAEGILKSSPSSPKAAPVKSPHMPTSVKPCGASVPSTGKLVLRTTSAKSSGSSKQPTGLPAFRKSDSIYKTSSTRVNTEASTSVKDPKHSCNPVTKAISPQPGGAKQLSSCKSSLPYSSFKSGQLDKKHAISSTVQKPGLSRDVEKQKDEKSSVLPRSAGLTQLVPAATLNDEELALLLHQELNSSPRVPRVPRVRQAIASSQPASAQPSNISAKRPMGNGPATVQKEHRLMWRKKYKDDFKEGSRGEDCSKYGETILNRKHEEGDDEAASSREDSAEASEGANEVGSVENGAVEQNEPASISSKKHSSPSSDADDMTEGGVALPGLIDEVLSKGNQISSGDVCEAVFPHRHKLHKTFVETYMYSSAHQSVLECLSNRSDSVQGVKEKCRVESSSVTEVGSVPRKFDHEVTNKAERWSMDSDRKSQLDGVPKSRGRWNRPIDGGTKDETDGRGCESEDVNVLDNPLSSSDDDVSNYSEEDEEMIVHRGHKINQEAADASEEDDTGS